MQCQKLSKDMNLDGLHTISDLWLQVKWFLTLPGDLIIQMIARHEDWRVYLELSPATCGGAGSAVMSFFAWLIVYALLSEMRL